MIERRKSALVDSQSVFVEIKIVLIDGKRAVVESKSVPCLVLDQYSKSTLL